ncbi:NDUA8-like protein [Mya arenaria]|uniref:NDUA8-like protein n=1 Tax=Mya arenaria TaxID=6604 RepID=A0ABY7E682_MYAAR|nr:NADH dehydrogenase [ubiquinone] 1 alpha subcomplex subunit 8-like [Mya arenaria]XP_052804718.1 NADH dehydrogenase [ubiquinone] 1 alpha subcomplex subunit 8-like [Mya arenaria]WAR04450.1 NDUA8-like protein [Mya arenaria]
MALSRDKYIPSQEELTIPEVQISSIILKAASLYMGKYCDNEYKEFALCRDENKDPRPCINEGKQVTRCSNNFLHEVKKHCLTDFTAYWNCLDHSFDQKFSYCRKYQEKLDSCFAEKMNLMRPEIGYYGKVRVHDTDRPKPDLSTPVPDLDVPPPVGDRKPKAKIYPQSTGIL